MTAERGDRILQPVGGNVGDGRKETWMEISTTATSLAGGCLPNHTQGAYQALLVCDSAESAGRTRTSANSSHHHFFFFSLSGSPPQYSVLLCRSSDGDRSDKKTFAIPPSPVGREIAHQTPQCRLTNERTNLAWKRWVRVSPTAATWPAGRIMIKFYLIRRPVISWPGPLPLSATARPRSNQDKAKLPTFAWRPLGASRGMSSRPARRNKHSTRRLILIVHRRRSGTPGQGSLEHPT